MGGLFHCPVPSSKDLAWILTFSMEYFCSMVIDIFVSWHTILESIRKAKLLLLSAFVTTVLLLSIFWSWFKWVYSRLFWFMSVLFKQHFDIKIGCLHPNSNSNRQSRRQSCWPLNHQNGPFSVFFVGNKLIKHSKSVTSFARFLWFDSFDRQFKSGIISLVDWYRVDKEKIMEKRTRIAHQK